MRWEYRDEMVMFEETPNGLASNLGWLHEAGDEGWELVGCVPLVAPNKDGFAYGTVGLVAILKRAAGDAQ
jgi:hypothetical protein